MKKTVLLGIALCLACALSARNAAQVVFAWGDTDVKVMPWQKPAMLSKAFEFAAWRGEKINTEALIWSASALDETSVSISDLRCGKAVIPASAADIHYVRYVKGDVLAEGYNQCGKRDTVSWTPMMAADLIDDACSGPVAADCWQPVWLSIKVPCDAAPGRYRGTLSLSAGAVTRTLKVELEVIDRLMPAPAEWAFHLDLWQNPYTFARVYDVPLWSEAHFEAMRPVMKMLADAGQKVVTTTILDRPWNGQTEDPFGSMVTKMRRADGSWLYDYTAFDMWVEFMETVGISSQINCYSLIPWSLAFDYYDQASGQVKILKADPQSKEYALYWGRFITDFASHLRAKGWFDKTYIAMDERPLESMTAALELIKSVEPEMKVALAGNLHRAIEENIDDLCVGFREEFPSDVRMERASRGQISTWYTCCAERYPNTFMASVPAEAAWIGWYTFAKGFDGYLRWAFNSWTRDPDHDSRFRSWAAGDCYMVYPYARSSVRFEKLIEGIRDHEKARVMRQAWTATSDEARLRQLETALKAFDFDEISANGAAPAIRAARAVINQK